MCCSRAKNGETSEGEGGGEANSSSATFSPAFCTHPIFCKTKRVSADETLAKLASEVGPFTPQLIQSILVTPLPVPFPTELLIHHYSYPIKIENNTWVRGDMEFLFDCLTRYLTSERFERRNSVSPNKHVFFCFMSTPYFQDEVALIHGSCHSFILRASDVSAADWRS